MIVSGLLGLGANLIYFALFAIYDTEEYYSVYNAIISTRLECKSYFAISTCGVGVFIITLNFFTMKPELMG